MEKGKEIYSSVAANKAEWMEQLKEERAQCMLGPRKQPNL